jgi:hypothetical protein
MCVGGGGKSPTGQISGGKKSYGADFRGENVLWGRFRGGGQKSGGRCPKGANVRGAKVRGAEILRGQKSGGQMS